MTLSEVQETLPFQLISQHVNSHQDKERAFADLTRSPLDIRLRFQSARTRIATISSDIRQYFPGIADNAT
jgi:hypothetical protein